MRSTDLNKSIPERPQNLISSRSVEGYTYDDRNYVLDIWYRGKKQSLYRYFVVFPPVMAQIFNTGSGIGLKARNILKGYRYIKLR